MKNKGFTLIELLVVIAIIGLLSTLAVVALGNARVKARDAKRMSDLKQIQTALELYYTDNNAYPNNDDLTLGSVNALCLGSAGFAASCGSGAYMGSVPADPLDDQSYVYDYDAVSSTYSVTATLEDEVNGLSDDIELSPSGIADI